VACGDLSCSTTAGRDCVSAVHAVYIAIATELLQGWVCTSLGAGSIISPMRLACVVVVGAEGTPLRCVLRAWAVGRGGAGVK
jgi:hypothetical protein